MAVIGNPSPFSKEYQQDNWHIQLSLTPKTDTSPDLLKLDDLTLLQIDVSRAGNQSVTIGLSQGKTLNHIHEAFMIIDQSIYDFQHSTNRDIFIIRLQLDKIREGCFQSRGDMQLAISKKLSNSITKIIYKYSFLLEINNRNVNRNVFSDPGQTGKFQISGDQIQQQIRTLSDRLDTLEGKIGLIYETVCYDRENQWKTYILVLQKIFQDQARKKLDQAKQSLKTYLSDPILQAIDTILSLPRSQAIVYREVAALFPNQNNWIQELTLGLESFREKYIPNIAMDVPEFIYDKTYSQFLSSDYRVGLQDNLRYDQEPDDLVLDPEHAYRKAIWRKFKSRLDHFDPVFDPVCDWGNIKNDWDSFLYTEWIPSLRKIEQVDETGSGNPMVAHAIDQFFTTILEPIGLEILPVEIGESYEPRKHEKDPIRSYNTSSTVTRVFNRGIKYKNSDDIYLPAKVSIG